MADARYGDRGQTYQPQPPASYTGSQGSRGGVLGSGRSTSELLQGIVGRVENIVRSEVRLATAEVTGEVKVAGRAAGMVAAAGVLALLALELMLYAIVYALSAVLPRWLAAIIVSAIVAGTAAIVGKAGYEQIRNVNPKPEQTIDSIKEDVQWVRQQSR